MKKTHLRPILLIGFLLAITCTALAYTSNDRTVNKVIKTILPVNPIYKPVTLSAQLPQNKFMAGGDGTVSLALTMTANKNDEGKAHHNGVDMVVVLDRSGSMQGKKLHDAKQAIKELLSNLSDGDRFALVSYSNNVSRHSNFLNMTQTNRLLLSSAVKGIRAGGGTNLGAGLKEGIKILKSKRGGMNQGRVILISDGLANHGITNPHTLGEIASSGVQMEFAVSTVGVGLDFNEYLMTSIADRGTGNYYYLENADGFAGVFQKEFMNSRTTVANSVEIHVPLNNNITLSDAAGYPVEYRGNTAIFRPGNLLAGQSRKLYLTFKMPADKEKKFDISGITLNYQHNAIPYTVALPEKLLIACVLDRTEVISSIHKKEWENKVIQEDYNMLRQEVAADIKAGEKESAIKKIDQYKAVKGSENAVVGSDVVRENIENDLDELRNRVEETFAGAPSAVVVKQKMNSKELQFRSYEGRRGNGK